MEQFRQPSQPDLEDYVTGGIDERTLLQRTRYFQTSNFDYRLFRPVMRYARDKHVPIVALNIPDEISHKVAQGGLAALRVTSGNGYRPRSTGRICATGSV